MDAYKAGSAEPPLPPLALPHLLDWLMELGPTEATGMGRAPIAWQTIAAWKRLTGAALTEWEALLLRKLSSQFLAESIAAESLNCAAPWSAVPTSIDHAANERQLRAVLG